MKNLLISGLACLTLTTLAGCDSAHETLAARAMEVFDMGQVPLPHSDYQLHGYRVVNEGEADHFVYLVEMSGLPMAGTTMNMVYREGKQEKRLVISSAIGDLSPTPPNNEATSRQLNQIVPPLPLLKPAGQAAAGMASPDPAAPMPHPDQQLTVTVSCKTKAQCGEIASALRRLSK